MTIPLSIMSEASSGGVCSKTALTADMIFFKGSAIASVISSELIATVLGKPLVASLPLISIRLISFSEESRALPIVTLIDSD